ncbi:MAG: hypothetical protein JWN82_169 [Candidatus Saccharibacteria bacterium]|nr:hypothetical protein [Candidatus Saccharibacteria bacterium]
MSTSTRGLEPLSVEQLWPAQVFRDDRVALPDEFGNQPAARWTYDVLGHLHTQSSPFYGLFTALAGGEGSLQADAQYHKPLVQAAEIGRTLIETGDEEVAILAGGLLEKIQEKRNERYTKNLRQLNGYIRRMDAAGRGFYLAYGSSQAVNVRLAKIEHVVTTDLSGTLNRREPYPILSGKDGTLGLKPHLNTRNEIIEIMPASAADL